MIGKSYKNCLMASLIVLLKVDALTEIKLFHLT